MYQTRKLILVSITKITGKDKVVPMKEFSSYKHEFLGEDNSITMGYSPNDQYKKQVTPVLKWEPEKAQDFIFESKEYQGVTTWKLVEATKALSIKRDLGLA